VEEATTNKTKSTLGGSRSQGRGIGLPESPFIHTGL